MPKSKKRKTAKGKAVTMKAHIDRKEFNYELNGVTLGFSLRTDIRGELDDFSEILKVALKDVEDIINTRFSQKK